MSEPGHDIIPRQAGTASEPIRVLVVDDHALFRRGLEMVLAQEPDFELVGEAVDERAVADALHRPVDAGADALQGVFGLGAHGAASTAGLSSTSSRSTW